MTQVAPENKLKTRMHYHVHNCRTEVIDGQPKFMFDVEKDPLQSEDTFEEELILLSFPIQHLNDVEHFLPQFNLKSSNEYFLDQCKDVISVSENHQNEKGGGKMSFQTFFHGVPDSLVSLCDSAVVVVAINPDGNPETSDIPVGYHMAGYIHANIFQFKAKETDTEVKNGYYYNLLRISEKESNGVKIYRKKRIFSLMFSILHSLTEINNVDFAFACMGKENESIKAALHSNSLRFEKHYERLPFTVYSKLNRVYGSSSAASKLVDISNDEARLKEMYQMVKKKMGKFIFFPYITEASFFSIIKSLRDYSKSTGVYMIPDADGKIAAATIAVNWGDYFMFKIKNPKGVFKLVQKSGVMDKFLRFLLSVGEPKPYKQLTKGLSHKYRKEHGVSVTFLPTHEGDPYYKTLKSLLDDKYMFFVICRNKQHFEEMKSYSAIGGHPNIFVDHALI